MSTLGERCRYTYKMEWPILTWHCSTIFKFTFSLYSNKKKSKKFKSSSSSVDVESDNTRTGSKSNKASNESIKHLTEFLDDRKELHAQLFSIIPKKEVKEMMPNILKVNYDKLRPKLMLFPV